MKPEHEKILSSIIMWAAVVFMVWSVVYNTYRIGYLNGTMDGREEQRETAKRIDCEIGFGDVPQYEITGECLKYFKLQEGN